MNYIKTSLIAALALTSANTVFAENDVTVEFLLPSELAALQDGATVAKVTVDREYYNIYWTIRCEDDADFFHGGSSAAAQAGAGTYEIIAFTPSAEPIVLNNGYTYTFEFQTCEFGWDGYNSVATFQVTGAGANAEQFSDIECLGLQGVTEGIYGYPYMPHYTISFSDPVTDVQAYAPMGQMGTERFLVTPTDMECMTWDIDCSSMSGTEGGFELHVAARDAVTGLRLKGDAGDYAFAFSIFVSASEPDVSLEEVLAAQKGASTYRIDGSRAETVKAGEVFIQNGKIVVKKQ